MTSHAPIDFQSVLRRLRKELSRNAIAMHASIPRSSLFNYENGTTPLHPVGERLLDMWCEMTKLPRSMAPQQVVMTVSKSHNQAIFQKRAIVT